MAAAISLFIIIISFGMTNINAMGFSVFGGSDKWKEEVQLSDGRVIVIERMKTYESGGDEWASNRRGIKPKDQYIRFVHPKEPSKTIEWKSIKKSSGGYPEIPLNLDINSENLVLFTIVGVGTACEAYNKYIYQNGTWIEEKLPEKFEPLPRNLFVRVFDEMPEYINLQTKRELLEKNEFIRIPLRQVGPTRKICG